MCSIKEDNIALVLTIVIRFLVIVCIIFLVGTSVGSLVVFRVALPLDGGFEHRSIINTSEHFILYFIDCSWRICPIVDII